MNWIPVPYEINGVQLWAVEADNGFIDKYCDTKERAQERCKELNDMAFIRKLEAE